EWPLRILDLRDVHADVGVRILEIGGEIARADAGAQVRLEARLRRDVQHAQIGLRVEIGLFLDEQREQPMPLERAAMRAHRLRAARIAERRKPPRRLFAHRAPAPGPTIDDAINEAPRRTQQWFEQSHRYE